MEAHKRKLGEDSHEYTKYQRTLIIQPGSTFIRIAQSDADKPLLIPSIIARKKSVESDSRGSSSSHSPHTSLNTSQYTTTLSAISNDLNNALKANKLVSNPQGQSQSISFNQQVVPEVLPSHLNSSDQYIDSNIDSSSLPSVLVGENVFKLTDSAKQFYDIKRPFLGGDFNTQDYSSLSLLLADIDTLLSNILTNIFSFTLSDIKSLSIALIIPNSYTATYVTEMTNVILNLVGCKQILLIQEANGTAFGCGLSSACVVDIGAQKTSIACVEEGVVIPESRMELAYGGDDITLFFHQLLIDAVFPYQPTNMADAGDWNIFENLKERACTLNESDLAITTHDFIVRKPNENSKKYSVRVYEDGIKAPNLLFHPQLVNFSEKHRASHKLWGDAPQTLDIGSGSVSQAMQISTINRVGSIEKDKKGARGKEKYTTEKTSMECEKDKDVLIESSKLPLHLAILNSISTTTTEERIKKFCTSLVLTGGGGHLKGVNQALEVKLKDALQLSPQYGFVDRVQHVPPPKDVHSQFLAWCGVSTLSKLEVANELWVGVEDFNALGLKALKDRTYLLSFWFVNSASLEPRCWIESIRDDRSMRTLNPFKILDKKFSRYRSVDTDTPTPLFPAFRKIPNEVETLVFGWIGSFVGIALLVGVFSYSDSLVGWNPYVVPSMGASCVLLFGSFESPLAQPRNLVFGHFLSGLTGVIFQRLFALNDGYTPSTTVFPDAMEVGQLTWLAASLATGTAVVVMQITGTIHPPAGATALIAITNPTAVSASWRFLYNLLVSTLLMLGWALFWNNTLMPAYKKKKQQLDKEREKSCQVCHAQPFKYQHPSTGLYYCSLPCYKAIQGGRRVPSTQHPMLTQPTAELGGSVDVKDKGKQSESEQTATVAATTTPAAAAVTTTTTPPPEQLETSKQVDAPLRPLHSLRWPEEPDEKIFIDALSRNDPKPLRRSQVLSIATSPEIRQLFQTHPNLKNLLAQLDSIDIDGSRNREVVLQRVLGYDANTLSGRSIHGLPAQLSNLQQSDREALQSLMECMNNSIEACNK
ncbi:hypothetical protein E3P77_03516 [Wallemia ichthyophaga]|uniref:Uncharacterized protein n=1 Tax=Wallemia ichthyophaga TaxID=245174 RepID=A0A4T0IAW7_WALIC|nr:hypothetical protein E3P90_00579 [Wallemia ichthyophaga]TIB17814.1 hypothetical protein E3P93_00436 [Wallemia ichthyophaga]TIB25497.1 hypothetical protein E3P89_00420 [Wallemia ichthyophaga]TIB27023.1 hypothetical protein E3P88_00448 [Wallemia ichthyophaga]TIB63512.1 hypothetical protein E3P77_03516 [Wallemia ichthyophaga]